MSKGDLGENMFLSSYMPQMSEWQSVHNRWLRPREVTSPESEGETKGLFCKVRAILGKLTPQNFHALTQQIIELDIDTQECLEGFAIEEATPLVAKMCQFLVSENVC
ncbi:Eukaryotic translation initiation factor 4 gamma 3 [Acropora cervicornis]|uniref:Eukaryotic translation initiation factor 4 gamma 3 n=1 Tax=Acropora cervicornis TaxID=6130 RepID=A0AAD9V1U0_ACRCE|nr:Eukaryotic translation initiation factor 4 gamma 3 [Acropora cervicornis]